MSFVYLTMDEELERKAIAYIARGNAYLAQGKRSYADGCYRKAQKKFRQSANLRMMRMGVYIV